jgi:hypothetical protein
MFSKSALFASDKALSQFASDKALSQFPKWRKISENSFG